MSKRASGPPRRPRNPIPRGVRPVQGQAMSRSKGANQPSRTLPDHRRAAVDLVAVDEAEDDEGGARQKDSD